MDGLVQGTVPRPCPAGPQVRGGARLGSAIRYTDALLAVFKVSCPVCQFTFPFLERGQQRLPAKEFGVTFPMLLDQELAGYPASNAFGVSTVPTLFLIDAGGEVAFSGEGFVKRDLADLGRRSGVEVFRQDESAPEWKAG